MAVRLALLLTAIGAAALFKPWPQAAHGFLLGGLAGTLAFWLNAVRVEKLAQSGKARAVFRPALASLLYLFLYIAALGKGYTLDKTGLHGLLGVGAGLFVIRGVAALLGLTGWDLDRKES